MASPRNKKHALEDSPTTTSRKQHDRRSGKEFLKSVTLGDLVKWRQSEGKNDSLLYISLDASARDAMAIMSRNKVLSLPVWDEAAKQYVCFLSVVDVLRFCMSAAMDTREGQDGEVLVRHVVKAIEVDEETQVEIWKPSDSASQAMEWFTLGIHRLLVADPNSDGSSTDGNPPPTHIISQTDVVRYIYHHLPELSSFVAATVEESNLTDANAPSIGPSRLDAITPDVTALQGFQKLFFARTSAVPIVDTEGKLVASLSASDLRGISAGEVDTLLLLPVLEFLQQRRSLKPFTCQPTTSLHEVMKTLVDSKVHRLWIVDQHEKLLGVITLTDLLCKFAPFDYKLLHSDLI